MSTGASSTPHPVRLPQDGMQFRRQMEAELWDDLANVIYVFTDTATHDITTGNSQTFSFDENIVMPVDGRFELSGQMQFNFSTQEALDVDADLIVDGVDVNSNISRLRLPDFNITSTARLTMPFDVGWDLERGSHTVGIQISNASGVQTIQVRHVELTLRRGRKPTA